MIENRTPYVGEVKLRFQKSPHYVGKSLFNKVHLNLGFTKLVSRVFPYKDTSGWIPDQDKIYKINRFTGGHIRKHEWEHMGQKFSLDNSFLSKDGKFIGDLMKGWWYYKNNLKVCDDHPIGVAIKYDNVENTTAYNTYKYGKANIIGYFGFTNSSQCLFKIGDRIYDPEYYPREEDYSVSEWSSYQFKYMKMFENNSEDKESIQKEGIRYVIPFTRLGSKTIRSWDDAKQAAINFSMNQLF